MSYEIRADYTETYLFPPSLEEFVAADHPARFLREFVDALDLKALGFAVRDRSLEDGRPNYAPDLLLKVWLYGWMSKIHSTRALERACREHLSLLWLTGMKSPDHNTLWRFFKENGQALREVFRQGVRVAAKAGLVDLALHAVDGTKVMAQCSGRTAWRRKDLEKMLPAVDRAIEEILSNIESDQSETQGGYELPEALQEGERLREEIQKALTELDEHKRDYLHPGEPEARMMKCAGKKAFAYNAQAVVDAKSGLIVAQDVVNAENDQKQLMPMLEEVEKNLGATAQETVADAGYESGPALAQAEALGYSVLVSLTRQSNPSPEAKPYHSSRFVYDPVHDTFRCPQGELLTYERTKWNRWKTYPVRVYRCHQCRSCPTRPQCTRDPRGRMIEHSAPHRAMQRQREKQNDPRMKARLKKRMAIVEPVFGRIKQAMGFRRFTAKGLQGASTQWSLICLAINLNKLLKYWLPTERISSAG